MRYAPLALAIVFALAPEALAQNSTAWFIGAGPSTVTQRGLAILQQDRFDLQTGDTVIAGGVRGRGAIAVGLTRALDGTALDARIEASYQVATSSPGDPRYFASAILANRNALRDEGFGLQAGLQWNAVPRSRWSPYIVTMAGIMTSRLAWNSDSSASRPNRREVSTGLAMNLGIGVRAVVFGANLFAESRRQFTHNVNGSRVMPLIVGVNVR